MSECSREADINVLSAMAATVGGRVEFDRRDWAISKVAPDYRSLLSTADLKELLDLRIIRCQYALLVRNSEGVPISEYTTTQTVGDSQVKGCVVPERFWKFHAAGATAHFRAVEHWHAGCRAVTNDLAGRAGIPVQVVAFLTPPRARGLTLHRDLVNLMVLQLEGYKTWHVETEPCRERVERGRVPEPPPATTDITLGPGDLLAMRPTVAHCADARDGTTLHVTFGLQQQGAHHAEAAPSAAGADAPVAVSARVAPSPPGESPTIGIGRSDHLNAIC